MTDREKPVLAIARSISEIMRRGCAVFDSVEGLLMEMGDGPDRPVAAKQREELAQKLSGMKDLAPDMRSPELLSALSDKDVRALLAVIGLDRNQPPTLPINAIGLPEMMEHEEQTWITLLDLSKRIPQDWCLVGGQMVHLHCWQRGVSPLKTTSDADVIMDVRARPAIRLQITDFLEKQGFVAQRPNVLTGHGQRWIKDKVIIDVLYPEGIGERAAARNGSSGASTVQVPGGTQALGRTQLVPISVPEQGGLISRPDLLGALVVKCAALSIADDPERERHHADIAILASMIESPISFRARLTGRDRRWIRNALGELPAEHEVWARIDDGTRVRDQLFRAVASS